MLPASRIFLHFPFLCLCMLYKFLYTSFLNTSCNLNKQVLLLLFQASNVLYTSRKLKQLLCFPVWLVQVLCLLWCLCKECNWSQHCICQAKLQWFLQFMAVAVNHWQSIMLRLLNSAKMMECWRITLTAGNVQHMLWLHQHTFPPVWHFLSSGFSIWIEEYFSFPPSSMMASLLTCLSEIQASAVVTRHRNCH